MKTTAVSGVNISLSIKVKEALPTGLCAITARVLTTASFADSPEIKADTARQSPRPSGAKTGARNRPMAAKILFSGESVKKKLQSKFSKNHMTIEPKKITVKAFFVKSFILIQTVCIAVCKLGR